MYEYRASLIRVIDGDTVEMLVDQGIKVFNKQTMRLYGINTPELNSTDPAERARAQAAKQFLVEHLPTDANALLIQTIKDGGDKYGRLLVKIYVGDTYINQALVDEGLAVPYLP